MDMPKGKDGSSKEFGTYPLNKRIGKNMARVHNMETFALLIKQNEVKGITWELGESKKYIKKIYCNGMEVVGNGQQYNMSSRNHELFEVLQANMDACHDMSASETKTMQGANRRGNIGTQKRVYIKDILNGYKELDADAIIAKNEETSIDGMITIFGNDYNSFKLNLIKSVATRIDFLKDIDGIDYKNLKVIGGKFVLTPHSMDLIRKGIERFNKKFNTCNC